MFTPSGTFYQGAIETASQSCGLTVLDFVLWSFGFVSDFEIRISDFYPRKAMVAPTFHSTRSMMRA
jgi:hypothetical protein